MDVDCNASLQSAPVAGLAATLPLADRDTPSHIVIVEDDPALRALLARILRECGYEVTGAADGIELQHAMIERPIDLILLDIMLPGPSGLELCQTIRERSRVPIIMVSARGEEGDRVTGLDNGADDYIAKPFGRAELLARVRAALRRASDTHVPLDIPVADRFDFADWNYHGRRRELISPRGAEVELTAAEHELLVTFLRNPQRTIGRERLLEMSRSRIGHPSDRSIDVMISRLRAKLGDGRRAQPLIRTIRGVGYMFAPDVTSS